MTGTTAASPVSAGTAPTRVVLADDQDLVRAGLRLMIDRAPGLTVVGEAATGGDAVRLAREARADVVLMDIRMPALDGLAATRRIAADESLAGVRVLILTTFEVDEYVFEALRSGASGFLGKGARPDVLIDAIRTVARGDALLSPPATRGLIARFLRLHDSEPVRASPLLATLTDREHEVVGLIADGMSNAEIARQLTLSPLTVKTHANHAMTKLGARDRAQLVVLAYQTGLARAPRPGRELPRRREDDPEHRARYRRGRSAAPLDRCKLRSSSRAMTRRISARYSGMISWGSTAARLPATVPVPAAARRPAAWSASRARAFCEPLTWRFDWFRPYTREEWLDQVPTFGGHSLLPPDVQAELLAGIGAAVDAAVDAAGGGFTMNDATLVATAAGEQAR